MEAYDPADDSRRSYDAAIEAKRIFLARVRAIFSYDPDTGVLSWRARERADFISKRGHSIWNSRYAGKEAGNLRRDGYRSVRLDGRLYLAHRIAWLITYGRWPATVDHVNGNPSDNRFANLREVTISENSQNMKRTIRNRTGVVGVRWSVRDQRWRAEITAAGRRYSLGDFTDFNAAVDARKAAEKRHGFHPNHGRNSA